LVTIFTHYTYVAEVELWVVKNKFNEYQGPKTGFKQQADRLSH